MLTVDSAKRGKAATDLFDDYYSLTIWNSVLFRVNSSKYRTFSCFRYFERLPGDVSCMPCTIDVDRAECVGKITPPSSTAPPININGETTLMESHGTENQETGSTNGTSHSNGMKKTKTIICNICIYFNCIELFFFFFFFLIFNDFTRFQGVI